MTNTSEIPRETLREAIDLVYNRGDERKEMQGWLDLKMLYQISGQKRAPVERVALALTAERAKNAALAERVERLEEAMKKILELEGSPGYEVTALIQAQLLAQRVLNPTTTND